MLVLRDYQLDAVNETRAAFRKVRSVLYQLSTGGGKSAIFNHIAASISHNGKKAAIVVHRDSLIQQNCAALDQQEIPHGVIAPGYPADHSKPIQVCSVWTLVRRLKDWPHFDLVIFDEAHHLAAGSFSQIHAAYPKAFKLCTTATPARLDGLGLAEYCDTLICGPSMRELIDMGYLARCEVYAPPTQLDLDNVRVRAGDYAINDLEKEMDRAVITGSAVEHYRRLVAPKPAIAFCVSIRHCDHVARQFTEAGYAAASIDGTMDRDTQRRLIADLGAAGLQVLASCNLISEGTDIPICQAVIMLRPTQSLTLFLQAVGRGMRPKADGSPMLLLDHVGNVSRHGMPDAPRRWTLEGRKRSTKDKLPDPSTRICEGCFYCFDRLADACPKCGLMVERKIRVIAERPGDLVRINGANLPLTSDSTTSPGINNQLDAALESVTQTWEQTTRKRLERVALERGYRPAWVAHALERQRAAIRRKRSGA